MATYSANGIEYPSVTTILNILGKGDALLQWAVNCACDYIKGKEAEIKEVGLDAVTSVAKVEWKSVRDEAMDIGTEIHSLIHKYIKFGRDATGELRPEVVNGFLAFLDWEKSHNVKWIQTEMQIVSRVHGYAGTLDAICLFDGKKYLIDFKSSKGFYDGYEMQLAAYRIGAAEIGHQTEGCGILRLDKETGNPEWKDYSEVQETSGQAFLALLKCYYLMKNRRLKNNPFILKPKSKKEIETFL